MIRLLRLPRRLVPVLPAVEVFTPRRRPLARRPLVIALLVAAAFGAGRATAADLALMGGWHSKHYGAAPGRFNEDNVGAGLQWRTSADLAWTVGGYRNSIRRTSFYVGGAWTPLALGDHLRAGLFAGFVTGYLDVPVAPFGGPMVEVTVGRIVVQGVVVPRLGDLNPYTVGAVRVGVAF